MHALTAALLKQQIEAQLAQRIPAALSPMARQQVELQPLRDPQLTALLGGGVPIGGITELHGEICSGRTSVALSLAAAVTAAARVVAWIDVTDELDPETAALCGVDLQRLLWIRCGKPAVDAAQPTTAAQIATAPDAASPIGEHRSEKTKPDAAANVKPLPTAANHELGSAAQSGGGSPHPRTESQGMAEAIDALLQQRPHYAAIPDRRSQKRIGTPGMPNRNVALAAQPPMVSHHVATVMARAAQFPDGLARSTSDHNTLQEQIVPTRGSLFGRQVGRNMQPGTDLLPQTRSATAKHGPMPFPNASPYREEQVPTDRQPSRRVQAARASKERPRTVLRECKTPAAPRNVESASGNVKSSWAQFDWAPLDQALRSVDLLLQAGGFSLLVLDLGSVPPEKAWRIPLATWFRFRAGCERSRGSLIVLSQQPCARASADLTVALQRSAQHSEGGRVLTGSSIAVSLEQQRRGTGLSAHGDSFAPQSKVVPFRKPVRSDHIGTDFPLAHTALSANGNARQWRAGAHWSLPA